MIFDSKDLVKYPQKSGVYLMKDKDGRVLYIGKAKNLKARLRSYFMKTGDERAMVRFLIRQVVTIEPIVVFSEREALILENNLIKKHKPKYNVLLKDDKTYVSLILTDHKWPALRLIRGQKKPKNAKNIFGPYTNAKMARDTLDLIERIFPLRECSNSELINRTRPCILYDIKRCIAPCTQKCTKDEYFKVVQSVQDFLSGKNKNMLKMLYQEMEKASEKLQFEKASELLNRIRKIEQIIDLQYVDHQAAKSCDVLGLYREADHVMIVKLMFREYKLLGSEHFSFHQILSEDEEIFQTFLLQHYGYKNKAPQEILVPLNLKEKQVLEELLYERKKKKISLHFPQKGKKAKLIKMAYENAHALFEKEEDARSLKEKMLLDLQQTLSLNRYPSKIKCFDTSHISGTNPVAAMVVFHNGERKSSLQRYFKISKNKKGDDYSALKEVLERHFEKNPFPDLLILDGGKGHLNVAMKVLKKLNIANVDLIGIAKESSLHTKGLTQEKIYKPYQKEPLKIEKHSPLLFLLQKIRDEAHRVALQFHQKRRSKSTIKTALDEIEGIGPKKKKRLLQKFKSVKRIKEASIEELSKIEGIHKKDIENLKNFL